MPRLNETFTLVRTNPHTHQGGAGTVTLDSDCSAVLLSATTANVIVTFDNSVPSSTNGIPIIAGAQPVLIPFGYHSHGSHNIRAAAGGVLDIIQLA
jgi:hypothetical protein